MADQAETEKTYFNITLMDKDMNIDTIVNETVLSSDLIIPDIIKPQDMGKMKEKLDKDPDCSE